MLTIADIRVIDRGCGWTVVIVWSDGVSVTQFGADPTHHGFIQLGDCWDFIARNNLFIGKGA